MVLSLHTLQHVFDQATRLQLQRVPLARFFNGARKVVAPPAPYGYQFIGSPQMLSTDGEGNWIVYAINIRWDVFGMLTYTSNEHGKHGKLIQFVVAQEAILTLFSLLDHLMDLTADCPSQFAMKYSQEIFTLFQSWKQIRSIEADARVCLFCWERDHPGQVFPSAESSKCCKEHEPLLHCAAVDRQVAS